MSTSRYLFTSRASGPASTETSEPMQINASRLTQEEKERRRLQNLCLYCGEAGHFRLNCPSRPRLRDVAPVSLTIDSLNPNSCVSVPLEFTINGQVVSTPALIDSGAAGNFMSRDYAMHLKIALIPCSSPLTFEAVDGRPLGSRRVFPRHSRDPHADWSPSP